MGFSGIPPCLCDVCAKSPSNLQTEFSQRESGKDWCIERMKSLIWDVMWTGCPTVQYACMAEACEPSMRPELLYLWKWNCHWLGDISLQAFLFRV
jgi:hypothetical protein